ncbi:DUF4232 domain-containing protein [Streptomyces sp. NPDC051994]|uniref:DUF4232 domain-containing protein n=1 Tax=unclassified Streptomyces TaxID=2593676 RepID=UPI0034230B59
MKFTRTAALAAIGLAATLSLTACNNGDDSGAAPSAKGPSSSSSSSSGGESSSGSGSGSGGSQTGKAKPGSGGNSSSSAGAGNGSGKSKFCRTSDLTIEAADSSPDKKTGDITVQMTNKGASTCSVTGFAGVDLKDADGTSAPVQRGHEQPRITDLKNGDTATFSISYPVDSSGKSLSKPTSIVVTPPNETHSVSLKWPANALPLAGPYDSRIQVHPVGIAN